MIFNKTYPSVEKELNKLISHGYTLQGDEKILKHSNKNTYFNGNKFSLVNNDICDESTKIRFLFKNELFKILIKIFHCYLIEELHIKKIKLYFNPNLKTYIYSSFYSIPNSKVFLIIPDMNKQAGIFDQPSIFYDGLAKGTATRLINTAIDENYCVSILNPYKTKNRNVSFDMDYYKLVEFAFKEHIEKKADFICDLVIYTSGLGGLALLKLLYNKIFANSNLKKNTKKIILGDSKHGDLYKILDKSDQEFWEKTVVNYIPQSTPLGTMEYSAKESGW